MTQHARPIGPTAVNDAAPFTSSMVAGWQPEKGFKIPQLVHLGWVAVPPDIPPLSVEMLGLDRPSTPRFGLMRGHQGWTVLPPDAPIAFAHESVIGVHADTSRQVKVQRGPSFFPWSGTTAPWSPDMSAGAHPDRSRAFAPKNQGWTILPSVDPFSVEMAIGSHPDRARFFSGPRPIGWQVSFPTHTAAPVTQEMVTGWTPPKPRLFISRAPHLPNVVQIDVFSIESTFGSRPFSPRLFSIRNHQGWSVSQPTHTAAPFSIDMVKGSPPLRGKIFTHQHLTPRDPISTDPVSSFKTFWVKINTYIGPGTDEPDET